MDRRFFLTGAASATAILPFGAAYAGNGTVTRIFSASRGSMNVGKQQITLTRRGDVVTIDLQTRLQAKILGISLYRYALNSREVWEGGVLQSISGNTTENNKTDFVEARRRGSVLNVNGSGFTGDVPGTITTSSFFTTDLINRKTWVSTQNGKPLKVAVSKRGRATLSLSGGKINCTHYHFAGQLKIPVDAYFDQNGDLAGYTFDAKGEKARVFATSTSQKLRSVWA